MQNLDDHPHPHPHPHPVSRKYKLSKLSKSRNYSVGVIRKSIKTTPPPPPPPQKKKKKKKKKKTQHTLIPRCGLRSFIILSLWFQCCHIPLMMNIRYLGTTVTTKMVIKLTNLHCFLLLYFRLILFHISPLINCDLLYEVLKLNTAHY